MERRPWAEASENLIVARTFAKAWGAAGLRIGYAVGNPATISLLHKMRPMYEVSTLAVECMSRMIDHRAVLQAVARINAGKALFESRMRRLGFDVLQTSATSATSASASVRTGPRRAGGKGALSCRLRSSVPGGLQSLQRCARTGDGTGGRHDRAVPGIAAMTDNQRSLCSRSWHGSMRPPCTRSTRRRPGTT